MSTALLLIDIQNDYFPGGSMALEGADAAGAQAARAHGAFLAALQGIYATLATASEVSP